MDSPGCRPHTRRQASSLTAYLWVFQIVHLVYRSWVICEKNTHTHHDSWTLSCCVWAAPVIVAMINSFNSYG